jgi:endonuclease-3
LTTTGPTGENRIFLILDRDPPMAATPQAKRHAAKIAQRLAKQYPDARCSLDFRSPLELLVATILSAQCTDQRVNQVTKTLFRKYPTVAYYARANLAELERDIQSTGFFRNKAKSIQNCCRTLLEEYSGEVPDEMEKLVKLQGVGRKTANVVLGTAYGVAVGVVVDTHVGRIIRRLGLSAEKDPEKIEKDLMGQFARKEWIALAHRLIQHGRRCCTAKKPKCDECPLESLCPKIGVAG